MNATEALERRIDELCVENDRLRQQVASIIGRSFRTADKMDCLNTENAKLRELCRKFIEYVSQDRCDGCVYKRRCDNGDIDDCWQRTKIREAAHELGIRFDEEA